MGPFLQTTGIKIFNNVWGWRCCLLAKGLPGMYKVLGLIPVMEQKKGKKSVTALEWVLFNNYQKAEFSTKKLNFSHCRSMQKHRSEITRAFNS